MQVSGNRHLPEGPLAHPNPTGWTSTFLIPLLSEKKISYASTTRDGRDGSLKFAFDPKDDFPSDDFKNLSNAKAVIIVFPIYDSGGSEKLIKWYRESHPSLHDDEIRWIQLGSTGIWDVSYLGIIGIMLICA